MRVSCDVRQQSNTFYHLLFPWAIDCVLYAVGKPVYHKSTNVTYGSWLKDSRPRNKEMDEKIWTTYETHNTSIYEFADKASFRNNQANELRLKFPGFQVHCLFTLNNVYYISSKGCWRLGWIVFFLYYTDSPFSRSLSPHLS